MALIDEGYRFASCELRTQGNDLLTKGKIIKIGPDFLEISNDLGSSSLTRYEFNVKVIISHHVLEPLVIEGRLYIPTMEFFRVIDTRTLVEGEQRNFFRVNVNLEATAGIEARGGGPIRNMSCILQDLSLNGALVHSKAILTVRTKMRLNFTIDGKEFMIMGVVVRCRAAQDGYYGYGVRFNQVDDNTANAIVQYLFKRQKEIIDI